MQITLNTAELTELDREILALISGGTRTTAPAEKPKTTAAAKTPAKAVKAEPEPEETTSDGPTLEQAVEAATKLVSTGKAKQVKAALESVGASRVSELEGDAIQGFLDALDVA